MMPAPTHLKGIVVPRDAAVDEQALSADLRCPCGGDVFDLLYPGQTHEYRGELIPCTAEIGGHYFFILRARCTHCSTDYLLLDGDFHGWDGFVCHDSAKAAVRRPPLVSWKCQACSESKHKVAVHLQTQGRDDFVSEAGRDFDAERWPDAFGWFSLDLTCTVCGKLSPELVSYETM